MSKMGIDSGLEQVESWEVFQSSRAVIERLVALTNSELIQEDEEVLESEPELSRP